ncbi:MAG TPA: glycine rich domain-containing protein [Frankiaceae bacterium]|nr:glycine rich domain-containing protein [Frankiaceae bacterium]
MAESYVVPPAVVALDVLLAGASGGTNETAGLGGTVAARINVAPGTVLTVNAGCANGYNGGGLARYRRNGGGASDIRTGAATLNDRIVVAGAGGGAGHLDGAAGGSGGFIGTRGAFGVDRQTGAVLYGGDGGSRTHGGSAGRVLIGSRCQLVDYPGDGEFGSGGGGAVPVPGSGGTGGGGGGGYYGGGGGDATCNGGGAGGGGSSFGPPDAVFATGVNLGDGYVEITPASAPAVSTPSPTFASDDCAGGTLIADVIAADDTRVRVLSRQPDSQTLWVCVRADGSAVRTGGKFVVTAPTGIGGRPTVDSASNACTATPGNGVPTPHPLLSGAVGDPADPTTFLPYLLDAYSGAQGTWVCVGVGPVQTRFVVPSGIGVSPAPVTFVADPPGPHPLAPVPAGTIPSGECQSRPSNNAYLDVASDAGRVLVHQRPVAENEVAICVRAESVAAVGGRLTVRVAGAEGLLPSVTTSSTDMSPCTVQVFHNDAPLIDIRRSSTGAVPASLCVTVGTDSLRVTVGTGSGGAPADVTWTPDPGTPGLP